MIYNKKKKHDMNIILYNTNKIAFTSYSQPQKSTQNEFIKKKDYKKYLKAQEYANSLINMSGQVNLNSCNIEKLEGIQKGIKVFQGVSMKQIFLLYQNLEIAALLRGCSNGCVHCYANAKPIHISKKDSQNIKAMSWEDFNSLTKGFAQLNQRLGLHNNGFRQTNKTYIVPFYDADCMEVVLKDKNNNIHDLIDITENVKHDMNQKVLFDTSGWNHKSEIMQKRAEKYVQYMLNHNDNFKGINISLNPFHKLNAKFVENITSNPHLAKKFRELYTDRMANVLYTFTPLFEKPQFDILNRALSKNLDTNPNYTTIAHIQLLDEIKQKLKKLYIENNISDIDKKLELFDLKTSRIETDLICTGRIKNILPEDSKKNSPLYEEISAERIKTKKQPARILENYLAHLLLDSNGKVYLTDLLDVRPTDIWLNFENKNKKTPEFYAMLKQKISTSDMFYETESLIKKLFIRLFK